MKILVKKRIARIVSSVALSYGLYPEMLPCDPNSDQILLSIDFEAPRETFRFGRWVGRHCKPDELIIVSDNDMGMD